ncbi:hypothetical protein D3C80_1158630 [compost metagenome]
MDFLAGRTRHDRNLRPLDARPLRRTVRRQRHPRRDRLETVAIFRLVAIRLIGTVDNTVARTDDHMLFIGMIGMGNLVRREPPARLQNARGGRAEHTVMIRLDRLGSEFLRPLGLFNRADPGRIFIKLALRRIRHLHQRRRHRARHHARRLEVPVRARPLARYIGEPPCPVIDVVAVRRPLRQTHPALALRRSRRGKPAAGAVGHMQLVGTVLMAEPVEQPVLLETARQIIKVRLVPLHAVVLRRRRRDDARRVGRRNAMFGKQRLDDLHRRLVHPDAAIRPPRQKPHLRPDRQRVGAQPTGDRRALMQFRHQTVERPADAAALFPVSLAYLDRHIDKPPDQLLGLDRFLLCTQRQVNFEKPRNTLVNRKSFRQKLVFP